MRHCYLAGILLTLILVSCAPIQLHMEARNVVVSLNSPRPSCRYLGQVTGFQETLTDLNISERRFQNGAMNDMKNRAASLCGNYVQLILRRTGKMDSLTGEDGLLNVPLPPSYIKYFGNVYACCEVSKSMSTDCQRM